MKFFSVLFPSGVHPGDWTLTEVLSSPLDPQHPPLILYREIKLSTRRDIIKQSVPPWLFGIYFLFTERGRIRRLGCSYFTVHMPPNPIGTQMQAV